MVRTSGVRITQRRVQEDIRDATAPDVDGLGRDVCEDDAIGIDAPSGCLGPNARLAVWREAQQPQHRLRDAPQDVAPRQEGLRVILQPRKDTSRQAPTLKCQDAFGSPCFSKMLQPEEEVH